MSPLCLRLARESDELARNPRYARVICAAVIGLAMCAALGACKKSVSKTDCLGWKAHYLELEANAQKRVDACKPAPAGKDMWDQLSKNADETTTVLCNHLDGLTPPTPEAARCFTQAKTPAEVKVCNVGDSALTAFAYSAKGLDTQVEAACETK